MHAHDRTYLSALGFCDPDKQNPLHDLACQYLNEKSVGEALAQTEIWSPYAKKNRDNVAYVKHGYEGAALETPITKGSNQYLTVVGFLDARMHWFNAYEEERTWSDNTKDVCTHYDFTGLFVEVKIAPVPVGDVLRQIHLYGSFLVQQQNQIVPYRGDWALVTAYDVSAEDYETLRKNNILHLRLGENFDSYVAWRRTQQSVPSPKTVRI